MDQTTTTYLKVRLECPHITVPPTIICVHIPSNGEALALRPVGQVTVLRAVVVGGRGRGGGVGRGIILLISIMVMVLRCVIVQIHHLPRVLGTGCSSDKKTQISIYTTIL